MLKRNLKTGGINLVVYNIWLWFRKRALREMCFNGQVFFIARCKKLKLMFYDSLTRETQQVMDGESKLSQDGNQASTRRGMC